MERMINGVKVVFQGDPRETARRCIRLLEELGESENVKGPDKDGDGRCSDASSADG